MPALIAAYEASGRGLVLSTRVDGRYAVRLCVLNHTTRAEHVEAVLDYFATAPLGPPRGVDGARSPHMMDVGAGWLRTASSLGQHGCRATGDDFHAKHTALVHGTRGQGRVAGQRGMV